MAILAPGQGAQKPGMLSPWLELDGVAERVAGWSELTGLDLARLGSTAEAEEIQDTAITQPLIVATTLIAYTELARRTAIPDAVPVAGHSIGELAAAAIAGVFGVDDAVALAGVRGQAMAAACALEPTGMAAVMGGDPDEVTAWLEGLELAPANINGAGQIVAAGSRAALDKLSAADGPGVTKVIALKVAGAFHTHFMSPAEDALRERAAGVAVADPRHPLLSNADGDVVDAGAEELRRLIAQVTRPVRWDLCMATLGRLGVTGVVELTPPGALVGLVRRELKGTATLQLKTPADLDKAAAFLAEHTAPTSNPEGE